MFDLVLPENKIKQQSFISSKNKYNREFIYRSVLRGRSVLRPPTGILPVAELDSVETMSNVHNLESFINEHKGILDSLSERKIRGQVLSQLEETILSFLNEKLDELLATPVPKRHTELMSTVQDAKRFLRSQGR